MADILVVGGAGYIGSHTAKALARAGYTPVVFDSLVKGHRRAVKWGPLLVGDLGDRAALDAAFAGRRFEAVIHFASYIAVGESMREPGAYFRNNVSNTLNLLEAMRAHGVRIIVFSSTAAVYGDPIQVPIPESHPKNPVSPYGESKWMVERLLHWYGVCHGFRSACLRYFNAAGADAEGDTGEDHDPETHLIPLAIRAAMGLWPALEIFGTDYPSADGTAIRDYIHVTDLAEAHILAMRYLLEGGQSTALNLGTGKGMTVRQVITAVERAAGKPVPARECPRRAGDAAELVADPSLAKALLGWEPRFSSLENIVRTAWNWHSTRPHSPQ